MDPKRRALLAAGAAVAARAAVPRVLAQQPASRGTGKFFEKGSVRIYYEEAGSGVPLLLLPGGGSPWSYGFRTPPAPPDGKWVVRATFPEPGTYVLRCLAHDGGLSTAEDVTVTVR